MATTLFYLNQFVTKTLNGGIDDSQTSSITLNNSTGLDTSKPGIAAFTWADPLSTSTVEWISYTSISANVLQGVVRGIEGGAGKAHLNGATIAFPISESHINNLATALSIEADATDGVQGVLDEDDMSSDSAVKLATQQSIKAYTDTTIGELPLGAKTELTIASGVVTKTQVWHTIDTEGDGASDDLDTINGGSDGDILIVKPANTSRTVVLKNGTGNIVCPADITLDNGSDTAVFIYTGTNWVALSSSNNGA